RERTRAADPPALRRRRRRQRHVLRAAACRTRGRDMKVLVADDSPAVLRLTAKAVEQLGHRCLTARDGAQALEMFPAGPPDVVITDGQLTNLTGIESTRGIRSMDGPYVYVVLRTGNPPPESMRAALEAGVDDLLSKSAPASELRTRMGTAARLLENDRN